jgi:single-strand DNA-binding protein
MRLTANVNLAIDIPERVTFISTSLTTLPINNALLIGRVVKDVEMKVTLSGISMARFTLAVNRIRPRDGKEGVTDFIRIVFWRRQAEIANTYLKKGKLIAVEGRLQISSYERDGETVKSAEIVGDTFQMLDWGNESVEKSTEDLLERS